MTRLYHLIPFNLKFVYLISLVGKRHSLKHVCNNILNIYLSYRTELEKNSKSYQFKGNCSKYLEMINRLNKNPH